MKPHKIYPVKSKEPEKKGSKTLGVWEERKIRRSPGEGRKELLPTSTGFFQVEDLFTVCVSEQC
jgi:hypothetical protein